MSDSGETLSEKLHRQVTVPAQLEQERLEQLRRDQDLIVAKSRRDAVLRSITSNANWKVAERAEAFKKQVADEAAWRSASDIRSNRERCLEQIPDKLRELASYVQSMSITMNLTHFPLTQFGSNDGVRGFGAAAFNWLKSELTTENKIPARTAPHGWIFDKNCLARERPGTPGSTYSWVDEFGGNHTSITYPTSAEPLTYYESGLALTNQGTVVVYDDTTGIKYNCTPSDFMKNEDGTTPHGITEATEKLYARSKYANLPEGVDFPMDDRRFEAMLQIGQTDITYLDRLDAKLVQWGTVICTDRGNGATRRI